MEGSLTERHLQTAAQLAGKTQRRTGHGAACFPGGHVRTGSNARSPSDRSSETHAAWHSPTRIRPDRTPVHRRAETPAGPQTCVISTYSLNCFRGIPTVDLSEPIWIGCQSGIHVPESEPSNRISMTACGQPKCRLNASQSGPCPISSTPATPSSK